MVDPEIRDGHQIAALLEAEIDGFENPPFDRLAFVWVGAEGGADTKDGETTPDFVLAMGDDRIATGTIQPDRVLLEFRTRQAAVAEAASDAELRVRPKAATPPATLVFVERGAAVKRVIDVLRESLPVQ